eukprot:g9710.t1
MDAWRQDKLTTTCKALGKIDKRAGKLVNRINASPVGTWHSDKKVARWTDELARLQDMSDRLLGFKGKLYIYSDLAYVEAVREWENEIQKICKRADSLHRESRKATSTK